MGSRRRKKQHCEHGRARPWPHIKNYTFFEVIFYILFIFCNPLMVRVCLASSASLAGAGFRVIFHVGFAARHPPRSWTFEIFTIFFLSAWIVSTFMGPCPFCVSGIWFVNLFPFFGPENKLPHGDGQAKYFYDELPIRFTFRRQNK